MRKIIAALKEYRLAHIDASKPENQTRISEIKQRFDNLDYLLSGVRLNEYGGFDDPETRLQETMTSADFTHALGEFVQRRMVPSYKRGKFDFEPLVKPDTAPNYLPVTRYQNRGSLDDLEYVGEKGEARPGSVDDATPRQYQVYKFKKQYDFSMEALVNDDLGYFADLGTRMGEAARRSQEKFVARMFTNATTIARLVALGALYSTTGRLTTARISTARMAFGQRVDSRGEMIQAPLTYIVYHPGLEDTVATILNSTLVPELATNAVNVVKGTFKPIKCPYITGTAPNLPWYAFADWNDGVIPFIFGRREGMPSPKLFRKRSDREYVADLLGAGTAVPPIFGDFATNNIEFEIEDEWGTYIDGTEGNMFDNRGCYYSDGTAA